MRLETERLIITNFTLDMVKDVHLNSLDEDNRRFVPDEVFETEEDARETVEFLMSQYDGDEGPFVHPILLKTGENIGYIQLVKIENGWEVGYHVGEKYTKHGYATEAAKAFVPYMMDEKKLQEVHGICIAENVASRIVLERSGFEKVFEGMGMYQGEERMICKYVFKNAR
ncbi:MAG: GNAT family N-acetyltransferase [Lachnospiraceae bacterium]|nr:GNAT family N-acetyltransferase [Lachnospiraceae bacterium]